MRLVIAWAALLGLGAAAAPPGAVVGIAPKGAVVGIAPKGAVVGIAPPGAVVGIDNFSFTPALITVAAGTEITWTNNDDIAHTVTGTDGAPRSPPLDTGEHFAYRFDQPGRYRYFCSLHAHMQGVVVVQ